jgi:hypothetical protein
VSNPEFKAYGSERMRFVESDEKAIVREANDYLSRGHRNIGYYTDNCQDQTAVPVVLRESEVCPDCESSGRIGTDDDEDTCQKCDGEGCTYTYVPGVRGPDDDEAAGCFDFADTASDAKEAALRAHSLTERYAEDCRENDAKFQCAQQIESALESIKNARKQHSALIRETKHVAGARYLGMASASYGTLKAARAALRREVSQAHQRIKLLRDEPWRAVEY